MKEYRIRAKKHSKNIPFFVMEDRYITFYNPHSKIKTWKTESGAKRYINKIDEANVRSWGLEVEEGGKSIHNFIF